jgi:hypothetical protein
MDEGMWAVVLLLQGVWAESEACQAVCESLRMWERENTGVEQRRRLARVTKTWGIIYDGMVDPEVLPSTHQSSIILLAH